MVFGYIDGCCHVQREQRHFGRDMGEPGGWVPRRYLRAALTGVGERS
jgi:hypothetical protein